MTKGSWAFLMIGFVIGFAIFYTWTKQRAPGIVRATPLPVESGVASGSPGSTPPGSMREPPAPPIDMARVGELQAKIKSNPQDFDTLVELGNLHAGQKNYQDAANYYEKALGVRPNDVDVRTDLGTMFFYENRHEEAIAQFQKSLELSPNHPQTLFNMGVAMLHGKNDPKGALQYWEKLVESNPKFPEIAFVKEQIQVLKEQQKKP